jgi:2-keto-4-pentenoate hydratase
MSLAENEIESVVGRLLESRRSGRPIPEPQAKLDSAAAAHRIQDAVAKRHGGVHGWKVGSKGPGAMPTCAPLLAGTVAQPAGRHEFAVRGPIGVEVEIAFVLGDGFAASKQGPDDEAIRRVIASCHVAIELCAMRWQGDPNRIDPLWKLADNQMNERLLLGPAIENWRGADFRSRAAILSVDESEAQTPSKPANDDLLGLLAWLVRHCVAERDGIAEGAVITTGSWTGMHFLEAPAEVVGTIGDFPPICITLRRP